MNQYKFLMKFQLKLNFYLIYFYIENSKTRKAEKENDTVEMDVSEDIEECLNIKIEMEEIDNRSDDSLQPFVKNELEVKENCQGKNLA